MADRRKRTASRSTSGRRRRTNRPTGSSSAETKRQGKTRWSASVMERSDALDLEPGVFRMRSPRQVAASLKHSAEESRRRKGTPFQSAMSMLTFYINRAGRQLSAGRKRVLERAKAELRKAFGRPA